MSRLLKVELGPKEKGLLERAEHKLGGLRLGGTPCRKAVRKEETAGRRVPTVEGFEAQGECTQGGWQPWSAAVQCAYLHEGREGWWQFPPASVGRKSVT